MQAELIAKATSAFAVVAVPFLKFLLPNARGSIDSNIRLHERLPEGSEAKPELLRHIDEQIRLMIVDERAKRRDPSGITVACILLIAGAPLGYLALTHGGWSTW